MKERRTDRLERPAAADRFDVASLAFVILLLVFSVVDALLTLHLLDHGCAEVNPIMSYLLTKGILPFLIGKYVLTAAGLPVLLIFNNHRLFRTGFRVRYLLPLFVILYMLLLAYQWFLIESR